MPGSVFSHNIHWAERDVPGTAELEKHSGPGLCQGYVNTQQPPP